MTGSTFSFNPSLLKLFLWCTPRFRSWPTAFCSLYNSPLFGDLKKVPSNIICTLMTPSCTSLSLLQILFYFLKQLPSLPLTYSPGWTRTNCFSIHHKLNFFLLAQNNNCLKFSDLTNLSLSNDIIPVSSSARNHLWLWHIFLWSNQLCIQILSFSHPRHPSNSSSYAFSIQPKLLQIH